MSLARELLPPVFVRGLRSVRDKAFPPDPLFEGNGEMFRRLAATAAVYGEYGVGASTDWVYEHTQARILAAESSPEWAQTVLEGKDAARIELEHIDIGPLIAWGRPLNFSKRDNFRRYQESIWLRPSKPDLVLVDGRFRVCCFLTSVLHGGPGLRIVFDDYFTRPQYSIVEEVLPVTERCGRQALFVIDRSIDLAEVARLRDKFEFVTD